MTEEKRQCVAMVCTASRFRPCYTASVRWLDFDEDFELARELWGLYGFDLLKDMWLSWRDEGYTYCAVIVDGKIASRAAVFTRTDHEWEAAAVVTREEYRNQGYAKSAVSFVTQEILDNGRVATCHTACDNAAMIATARSVGFVTREEAAEMAG